MVVRLPVVRGPEGRRSDRGQAGGHDAVGGGVAERDVCRGVACRGPPQGGDHGRPPSLRVRGQRLGDSLHQWLRPEPESPAGLRVPATRHPRPDPARRRRRAGTPDVAGEGRRVAGVGRQGVASGADHRDRWHRAIPGGAAFRPVAGADGDRGWQDVRRGDGGIPAVEAWRVQPGAVPGRSQQPGGSDVGGVPELPNPR